MAIASDRDVNRLKGESAETETEKELKKKEMRMNKTLVIAASLLAGASSYAATLITPVPYPSVQAPGSDAQASAFNAGQLPGFSALASGLPGGPANAFAQEGITDSDNGFSARVYFVSESAGYANSLRFTDDGSGAPQGSGAILDFSSEAPASLSPGSFVDLGSFSAGTPLDFFIIADGGRRPLPPGYFNVYSTRNGVNDPDSGLDHVRQLAKTTSGDSTYYLFAFEDLPLSQSDLDYNDVIFAVELTKTPEPATIAVLGSFLGLAYWIRRRQTA